MDTNKQHTYKQSIKHCSDKGDFKSFQTIIQISKFAIKVATFPLQISN